MRFTAFVVVFVFTVTSVTWTTPVSAAPTDVAAPVVSSIDKLAIPAEMGSIQKMFLGTRTSGLETTRNPNESLATNPEPRHDRMVVLIQDAHAVIDAQENIAKILGHLQKNYGIRLAALEGAKGRLEPVLLRTFPEPDVKHKILTGYEQRAELSGPEMAAILQEEVGEYHGMEDWGLYAKNYFAYLRAQEKKEALLSRWNAFKRTLDTERAKVYDSKLNEFQEAREDFLTDRAALLDLLVYLSKFQNLFKTASGYQELPGLIASIGYEKSGKQDALVPHVRKIVDEFKMKYLRGLGVKTEMNFYNRYQAFLTGQITAGQMLQYLVQVGSENGKSVKLTPDLKKLLGHAELLSEIKGSRLCDELQRFLPAVEASLLKTPAQREMAEKYQKLYLLKEMIELELTHESLAEYQKEPDSYLSLITDSAFKQDFVPVAEFYQAALERDQAFMGRIETMMKDAKQKTVAVVAGGFHTNGLEHILREKGMAYAVVTPKIASLAGSENYAKVMKGEVSFKDYLKTTYFDALMRHSAKALVEALPIPDRVRTLKTWRDNVIRELAREGRITEAGKYLPYIDEILQSMPEAATAIGPRRTREEILDIVRKELGGFKKDSLDRIWKTFEFQLDIFTDGLKQLIAKKDLNTQSVSALLDRASQTKPSFIALQKALEFDEEPVFAEASVTKSDATEPAGTARAELPIQTEPSQDVLRGKGDKITLLVRDHIATAVNSLVKSKAGSNVSEVKVLEMGIGSGVLTAELARTTNGAEFTGVDVNPGAVQMARQALGKYKNVSVLESDLFLAFRKGEKFDVIFWNPPWSAKKGGGALALAKSDPGFSTLGRFLDKAPTFLKPGGRVFLIMPPNAMKKIWDKADALYDIKVNGFETTKNRDIGIYELTPKRSQTSTATEPAKLTRAETRRLESEGEMNAHERLFSTIATIVARGFIAALPLSPFFVSSWLPHTALMTAGHPSFTALRTTLQAVSILLAVPAVLVMASTFANILSDLYAMFRGVEEGSPVERARRLLAEMKKDADPELRDILSVINDTEGHPGFIVQKPAPLDDAFTAKREIIISESISRYPAMLRYITLRRAADLDWVIGTIIAGEPLYEFDRLTFVNNVIYRYAGNNMFHVKLMNALGAGLDFAKVAIQRFFTGRMPETVLRDGKGPLRGARLEAFKKELIKDFVKTKASEASSAPAARAETLAALAAIGATIIKTKSFDQIPESAGEIILAAAREDLKRPDFRPNGLAEVLISMVPGKDGGESFYVIAPGSSKGVKNIHQVMLEAAGLSGHKEELIRGSFYFYVEGTPKKIGKLGRIFFVPGIQNEVVPDNRRKLNDLQQLAYFEQLAYFFRTALSRADEAQVRYTSETLNAVVVALPSVRIMSQIKPTAEGYVTLGQLAEAYMLSKTPGAKVLAAAAEATKPIGIVRSELRTASKDQVITPRAKVTEMKIKETGFSKSLRSAFRNLFLPIILAASMFFGSVTQSLGWNLQRDDRRASEE
ncbi:MAG: methyltransferase, partial [Candidatus Omnitrophota bacterium]